MQEGQAVLKTICSIIDLHQTTPGAMLPILHAIQDNVGYIPDQAVPLIAKGLNLSRAEVHGVITFYHHFRSKPSGCHVVQICRAESCQAMGASQLEAHAQQALGIEWHGTTADGSITLEPVYCLGNCACSPSLRVDDKIFGRVDTASLDGLLAQLRGEA